MPAGDEDQEEALKRASLQELATPVRVIRDKGHVVALECVRNELGAPGSDGRRRPMPLAGSEFSIQADSIIVAVGQSPDLVFLNDSKVHIHKDGVLGVDPATGLAQSRRSMRAGMRSAGHRVLLRPVPTGGVPLSRSARISASPSDPCPPACHSSRRRKSCRLNGPAQGGKTSVKLGKLPPAQRGGFELVEATLDDSAARTEAARCLQCSVVCDKCVEVCPNRANHSYGISPVQLIMPILACGNNKFTLVGETTLHIRQSTQIVHVHDLCNDCGNCATFCVHQGKPYRDKPRLFSRMTDFMKESDNAFYIERGRTGWTMYRREHRRESNWKCSKAWRGRL